MKTISAKDTDLIAYDALAEFVGSFDSLTTEEQEQLSNLIQVRWFAKGTTLIREDDYNPPCFFVLKGCLRQYQLWDGLEKTIQFFTENQAASLFSNNQAKSYLTCVEGN